MAVRKRYQVFVSSTFADLKEERKMVMRVILERKSFPAGMELFPAKDKKQFDYIKQVIDDSDYYLLIIGARYGSLDDDGVSYTEKEYDYAVSKKIPVIAFLHSDIKSIPLGKADVDKDLQQKLEAFRAKVQTGRLVEYWENAHDLKAKVISSLVDAFEDEEQPRIGWVRADSITNGDAQKEIDRLKKEIEKHRNEIKRLEVALKKKEGDYQTLESSYQSAQKEIENLTGQIQNLKTELEKLKASSVAIETKPRVQTEIITIPNTDVSFKMVYVEGGTFMMGANDADKVASSNERPAHVVTLSDYWIGETQVTQELWQAIMGENPSNFKREQNLPVECVSWDDCYRFIIKLNEKIGMNFHLPTEAQWEFAARGGNFGKRKQNRYAGRNFNIEHIAWYSENSEGKTHPVAQLSPNELGLYDMSGNVWEWCQDRYSLGYYSSSPNRDPKGPSGFGFSSYVCRGGGWLNKGWDCRVSTRNFCESRKGFPYIGLRLAL